MRLLIVGAGGFSLEAIWLAKTMNTASVADWKIIGLSDEHVSKGTVMGGFPVLGSPTEVVASLDEETFFHVAIGTNEVRLRLADYFISQGLKPATLISPNSEIADDVQIGAGSFVGRFASVGPESILGEQTMLSVHAVVGHEAHIGAGAQLCPGSVVTGRCRVGKGAFLGSNAALQPGITVGDWARVSANTFAAADVEPGVTLATMPGRPVFKRKRHR